MLAPPRGTRSGPRLPAVAGATASALAAGLAVAGLTALYADWRDPVYVMPVAVLVVAIVCTAAFVAGVALSWHDRDLRSWLSALVATLIVWGVLTIFSIGIGLLVLAVAAALLRHHVVQRRPAARRRRPPAGALLTAGVVPLTLFVLGRPVVQCIPGGAETSVPAWAFSSSSGGSGSGSAGGDVSGTVTYGSAGFAFTCSGDRLVRFVTR